MQKIVVWEWVVI